MCRRDFLSSERLVSAFLMTMKPVRLHKSVWRKSEYSCFCFLRGAIRRAESRSFHGCSSRREKRSRALPLETERVGECQGGELNSRPRAYESPALPLSYPGVKGAKLNRIAQSVNATER